MRKLSVGDWVEVRSKEEILRTLDRNGQLDGMPFMPEMFAFCGRRFQVYKRAHKTCDTVFPVRGRRVDQSVHLPTRCDGSAHGGCQAGCALFWKEVWLKKVEGSAVDGGTFQDTPHPENLDVGSPSTSCKETDLLRQAQAVDPNGGAARYVCQATQLPYATSKLEWWDIRQYIEDYTSGNVSLGRILGGATYMLYHAVSQAGIGLGPAMRWFYDKFNPLWRGTPFPRKRGTILDQEPTPTAVLNLQPGEMVRVKSHNDILKTLNTSNRNRGLYWDAEEVPYCGKTYRVLKRVDKIINDKTGKMQEMKTPSVILDSVICESRYSECRMFCPRSIYPYWREIWLERVEANTPTIAPQEESLR